MLVKGSLFALKCALKTLDLQANIIARIRTQIRTVYPWTDLDGPLGWSSLDTRVTSHLSRAKEA